jgi:hypothetical protein
MTKKVRAHPSNRVFLTFNADLLALKVDQPLARSASPSRVAVKNADACANFVESLLFCLTDGVHQRPLTRRRSAVWCNACWAADRSKAISSALGRNSRGEGLRNDLAVTHDKRVSSHFVNIVGRFCGPQNIGMFSIDRQLLDRERGTRLAKL